MNILIVGTSNFKPESGGIAELGHQLTKALHMSGHNITVFANLHKDSTNYDKECEYRILRINPNMCYTYLEKEFSNQKPDLIFILSIGSSIISCLRFGKKHNIPVALYVHGIEITKFKGPLFIQIVKKITKKFIIKQCNYIFCNSLNTMRLLLKFGVQSERIKILHPGINTEFLQENSVFISNKFSFIKDNDFIFLTLGRVIERKGIETVIRALKIVISKHQNTKYIIAGPVDEQYKKYLLTIARELNIDSYITFTGMVSDAEKKYLLSRQNCFIMPSKELPDGDVEGFGIVFLEAALFSKPVIAGNSGGIPDAVVHNKTGILVNPYSIDDVANAMIRLLNNNDLCLSFGKAGKERAINRFNWNKQAKLFITYINEKRSIAQILDKTNNQYYNILDTLPLNNPIEKISAYENLCILKEVLDSASIPFILFFGTLLGALREHDFISHDYDTDIVVLEPYKYMFIAIIPELERKGLILARTTKEDRVISLYRNNAYMDIYFATIKRIGLYYKWYIDYSTVKKDYLLYYKTINFKGLELSIPEKSEKILKRFYGKDWNIPKIDYEANPDYYMKLIRFIKKPNKILSLKRYINWILKR
ncbi:MAG: glycosyltransferase family 4 protein [Bacteroidales bacterium]|nr:glycosyltransferase family 4 protein [Bacteroidales bacterium]